MLMNVERCSYKTCAIVVYESLCWVYIMCAVLCIFMHVSLCMFYGIFLGVCVDTIEPWLRPR